MRRKIYDRLLQWKQEKISKAPQRVRGWFDEYLEDVDTLYVTATALDDRLSAQGLTAAEIARKLFLSVQPNVTDMLRRASESGII